MDLRDEAIHAAAVTSAVDTAPADPEAAVGMLFERADELAQLSWGVSAMRFTPSEALRTVVSADVIEGWLDCSLLRYPFFNVSMDGEALGLDEVSSPRVVGGQSEGGYIDGAKVRRCLGDGATVVLANLHEWHAPAQRLCRAVAERTQAKVGAVLFWTGPDTPGLRVHNDDAHVLVVQVSGVKRWSLYRAPAGAASWTPGYVNEDELGPAATLDMHPGQALYVPPGQAHKARTLGTHSMHLTIAVREPRLREVMMLAVNACLASVPEHASVTGDASDRERAARDLIERLSRALQRVDVSALVASAGRRAARSMGSL